MDFRIAVLTLALLGAATTAVVRAQDNDDAPAAASAAAAPAAAAPAPAASAASAPAATPVPAASPAPAATPAPAPAAAAPAATAAPTAAVAAAAPAPVPAVPAPKTVVNAATYTRDIGKLYAEMAKEADEFTAKNQAAIQALKDKEADIQGKLDAANQDYAEKSKDPAVLKETHFFTGNKILKGIKKQIKQLNNDLDSAKRETKRQTNSTIMQMWVMQKNHIAAMKAKYNEVEELVKAAEKE